MNNSDIDQLIEATKSGTSKERRAALLSLCPCHVRANVTVVWDRILELSSDADPGIRSIVLHNLCDGSPKDREQEVVNAVECLAQDDNLKIRRRARRALTSYRQTGNINVE